MPRDNTLTRISDLDDYQVAHGQPNVRGWNVKAVDNPNCGEVDDLVVDTESMQVRYLDVKLDAKSLQLSEERHALIPISAARLDDERDEVLLSEMTGASLLELPPLKAGEPIVSDASRAPGDHDVEQFYGKRGGAGDVERMTLSEEELNVGKREKPAGEVNVDKKVDTEHVSRDVPVTHEEVTVERRAVSPDSPGAEDISESETRIPLKAEEAVVEKRTVPKEEVVVTKKQVEGKQTVEADLKREHADVDRDTKHGTAKKGSK